MGEYKRYKPGNYAENIPNYGMSAKRSAIINLGDTKMPQAAPPGSAQDNAKNIAVYAGYVLQKQNRWTCIKKLLTNTKKITNHEIPDTDLLHKSQWSN